MALGSARGANIRHEGMATVSAGAGSTWIVANDDASTAQTGNALTPDAIADSTFHWVRRGHASKMLMRAVMTEGTATVTTDPQVLVMGMWGTLSENEGTYAPNIGARFLRLDNVDAAASSITLDIVDGGSNLLNSSNAAGDDYVPVSDPNSLTPIDLKGCDYVGILVTTAASVSAGTVPIEILLMQ